MLSSQYFLYFFAINEITFRFILGNLTKRFVLCSVRVTVLSRLPFHFPLIIKFLLLFWNFFQGITQREFIFSLFILVLNYYFLVSYITCSWIVRLPFNLVTWYKLGLHQSLFVCLQTSHLKHVSACMHALHFVWVLKHTFSRFILDL